MSETTTTETTERMASCYCGRTRPSSERKSLFGFQDRSATSKGATENCKHCGCYDFTHPDICEFNPGTGRPNGGRQGDHKFEPKGEMPTDSYYCGCRGWD